jgi:hypothetical protein
MKTYICLLWVVFGCIGWEMHASVDVHPTFITTSDGLANNSVRYLFQDSKGFIWMGTLDGLSRYDGHSFVTFRPESGDKISLANHHVKKIHPKTTHNRQIYVFIQFQSDSYQAFKYMTYIIFPTYAILAKIVKINGCALSTKEKSSIHSFPVSIHLSTLSSVCHPSPQLAEIHK